jgi:hypothetical protein
MNFILFTKFNDRYFDKLYVIHIEYFSKQSKHFLGERCYFADQSHQPRLRIGDSKEMVLKNEYVCVRCFALVTSESGLTENKQTRQYINGVDLRKFCSDIFAKMFSEGLYKVGFALPTGDPNLIGKLNAVIEAFQDIYTTQLYDNMPDSELIFGVKTEAERWMQEVDNTIKFAPYARCNISPRYKGKCSMIDSISFLFCQIIF